MKEIIFVISIIFGFILLSGCTTPDQGLSNYTSMIEGINECDETSVKDDLNATSLLIKANNLLKSGDFQEANAIYENLIADNSTDARVWFNYGVGLLEDGKYPQSIAMFEKAEKFGLNDTDPYWYNKGIANLGLGDFRNADRYFSMIDTFDTLYPQGLLLSAIANKKYGQNDGKKLMTDAGNYDVTKNLSIDNLELLDLEKYSEFSMPSYKKEETVIIEKDGNELIIAELQDLVTKYYETHEYSKEDFFVCTDMAIDLWNQCKVKGFKGYIVIGSLDKRFPQENEFNHAWVVIEPYPNQFIALDATSGTVDLENERYYNGYYFLNPKGIKDYQDLSDKYQNQILYYDIVIKRYNEVYSDYVNSLSKLNNDVDAYNQKYAGRLLNAFHSENAMNLEIQIEAERFEVNRLESELESLAYQIYSEKNKLNQLLRDIQNLPEFFRAAKLELQTPPPAILG